MDKYDIALLRRLRIIGNLIDVELNRYEVKTTTLNQFTDAQHENLKEIASNFYDIGDFESALLTLRILKENLFLDF
jgi:hypothetical protein